MPSKCGAASAAGTARARHAANSARRPARALPTGVAGAAARPPGRTEGDSVRGIAVAHPATQGRSSTSCRCRTPAMPAAMNLVRNNGGAIRPCKKAPLYNPSDQEFGARVHTPGPQDTRRRAGAGRVRPDAAPGAGVAAGHDGPCPSGAAAAAPGRRAAWRGGGGGAGAARSLTLHRRRCHPARSRGSGGAGAARSLVFALATAPRAAGAGHAGVM